MTGPAPADGWPDSDDPAEQAMADGTDALARLAEAVGASGPFETHEINGRHYVLLATPYCT